MTSRERIVAVLNRQIPDRVPVFPRIWAWLQERYGKATFLEYLNLKKVFDYDPLIQVNPELPNPIYMQFQDYALFEHLDVDLSCKDQGGKLLVQRRIKTPRGELTDVVLHPRPGREYGISPNSEKLEPLIKSEADLEKISCLLPDPRTFSASNYTLLDEAIGEQGFLEVRPHLGVDHLLVDSLGLTNSLMLSMDDLPLLKRILGFFHAYYKRCLVTALERGARMIFESWFNCSLSAGWPPDIYRECFLPLIAEDARITHEHGAFFHFYDDGKIMPLLESFKTSGIDLLSTLCPPPAGDVDGAEIKKTLGGIVALTGYVDLSVIRFGTPALVEEKVREAIEVLGNGGGFILGTSDSIRDGSPFENVKAFFDAGKKYGSYGPAS
jgi:uroporphyrinogen decarboxylase